MEEIKFNLETLIKALVILNKYSDHVFPCSAEHDMYHIYVDPKKVSKGDINLLGMYGFYPDYELMSFCSIIFA